jgi:hypothetical protein
VSITSDLIEAIEQGHLTSEDPRPQLTPAERAAVDRYNQALEGIEDCLDVVGAAQFADHEKEFGRDAAVDYARAHFGWLDTWHTALDSLHAQLGLTGEQDGVLHSTSRRLLEGESNRFFHQLNLVRREVCAWLLGGAGPRPDVDSGYVAYSNFPVIQLNGSIAAESE